MKREPETRARTSVRSQPRPTPLHTPLHTTRLAAVWTVAAAMLLSLFVAVPSATGATLTADSSSAELVKNPTFSDGTEGWRTNGGSQRLAVASGQARLTTTTGSGVVLNDATNTVLDAPANSTYAVSARVRTTTPPVNGALRVREVATGDVATHQSGFSLSDTSWQTVTLQVTTSMPSAKLDLNVLAWDLPIGDDLQIDSVSMKKADLRPIPEPIDPRPGPGPIVPPAPGPIEPPPGNCQGTPSRDTQFGASIYPVGMTPAESLADIDASFGTVPVVRDFFPGMPPAWNSSRAQLLRDRDVVISFKASPSAILSGQHDTYLRNWFATAPNDQTIYWSYLHEPEVKIKNGQFTPAQYRAAWEHVGELAEESCKPNMHSTLILTAWTIDPRSGRDYRDYDAGHDVVEVIAFDPYNALHDPNARTYTSAEDLIGPLAETMEEDGRPWGLAELGSRIVVGDNGSGRAEWLSDIGDVLIENDASFATYFQTTYKGVNFRLDDAPSRNAWKSLTQR